MLQTFVSLCPSERTSEPYFIILIYLQTAINNA